MKNCMRPKVMVIKPNLSSKKELGEGRLEKGYITNLGGNR